MSHLFNSFFSYCLTLSMLIRNITDFTKTNNLLSAYI